MKIIFWMLVIAGAIMLVRRYGALAAARARRDAQTASGQSAADAASARPAHADMMVACSICDLHLPASEAIFAHGRVYCCEAHQAQGKADACEALARARGWDLSECSAYSDSGSEPAVAGSG